MAQERSIEVKVGALILVSLTILAGFVLLMGGLSFERTYTIYVDFDNPGALQAGAPVRVAGLKVGKVQELQFLGGKVDPKTNRRTLIRAKIAVEQRMHDSIKEDADFFVTAQGVLGEQFLAIDPGSVQKPVLAEGAIVRGIDPPRLDLFLAKSYELVDTTINTLRNNREMFGEMATNVAGILKSLNGILTDNRDKVNHTVANVEALTGELNGMTKAARAQYVDNPHIAHTIENADKLTTDLQPIMKDAKEAMANVNRASAVVGGVEEQQKLKKAVDDLSQIAGRANAISSDAQTIVSHIKKGKGTVGALLMDEAIYDDVQEMVRDLKHNPWKFLWRE